VENAVFCNSKRQWVFIGYLFAEGNNQKRVAQTIENQRIEPLILANNPKEAVAPLFPFIFSIPVHLWRNGISLNSILLIA
jgi:hypothetical protein